MTLHLQALLNGLLFLGLVAQNILAIDDLVQGPYAGLHGSLGDLHQLLAGIAPAAGQGASSVLLVRPLAPDDVHHVWKTLSHGAAQEGIILGGRF